MALNASGRTAPIIRLWALGGDGSFRIELIRIGKNNKNIKKKIASTQPHDELHAPLGALEHVPALPADGHDRLGENRIEPLAGDGGLALRNLGAGDLRRVGK
jgi:hypothetical protein